MSGIYLGDKPTKTGAVVNADEIPLLDSQDLSSGRKKVKKVTAANLKSSILAEQPKVYAAVLSGGFEEDPTIQVIQNTLGFSVSWPRDSVTFSYAATPSTGGSFPAAKTFVHGANQYSKVSPDVDEWRSLTTSVNDGNLSIQLNKQDSSGTPIDGVLGECFVKIEIYP